MWHIAVFDGLLGDPKFQELEDLSVAEVGLTAEVQEHLEAGW